MNYEQEIKQINERFPDINALSKIEMQLLASEINQYILNFSDSKSDIVYVKHHIKNCLNGKYEPLEEIMGTFQNKPNTRNEVVYKNWKVIINV